ncbi:MAG: hypothetical protein ACK5N8_01655 [Alphaproteobacteria bacterium]
MAELINIKNGLVAVLKKNIRNSENLAKAYKNVSWDEILAHPKKHSEVDLISSQILKQYLFETTYNIDPEQYSNDLKKPFLTNRPKAHETYLHYPYKIKEEQIPKALKNIGISLKREVQYLYFEWDDKKEEVVIRDKKKNIIDYDNTKAILDDKTITFYDSIFVFNKDDFSEIKKIEKEIVDLEEKQEIYDATDFVLENVPKKYQKLYNSYTDFLLEEQDKDVVATLNHEFKHIKNSSLQESRISKPDCGNISPELAYEIEVEDERTASIQQVLGDIKNYLTQDDLDDFYDIDCELIVDDLEDTKPEKRKELLLDKKYVINAVLRNWDENLFNIYEEQLEECTKDYASVIPIHKTKMDKNERNIILNSFYTFSFYNPEKMKDEFVNVYSLVEEKNKVKITKKIRKKYIEPAKEILKQRVDSINNLLPNSQIDAGIIKKAEEMSYTSLHEERKKTLLKHKIYNRKQNYFQHITEIEQSSLKIAQPVFLKKVSGYTR